MRPILRRDERVRALERVLAGEPQKTVRRDMNLKRSTISDWIVAHRTGALTLADLRMRKAAWDVQEPASMQERSTNVKLGTAATTSVSISKTCPTSCGFRDRGCFAQDGILGQHARRLDAAAVNLRPIDVIRREADLIDASFGGGPVPRGLPLRLHVGGDAANAEGARILVEAARRWRHRGGGPVWTYTHLWREIPREAWGEISVLASVESPADALRATRLGYPAAIVVDHFPSDRAFLLDGVRVVPCPEETRGVRCADCRLCLDRDLLALGATIGFAVHGSGGRIGSTRARLRLPLFKET